MRALHDTDRLLDLLTEAGDEAVTLDELEVVGVTDPAAALLALEVAGHRVQRVYDGRTQCVRLAPAEVDGVEPLWSDAVGVDGAPARARRSRSTGAPARAQRSRSTGASVPRVALDAAASRALVAPARRDPRKVAGAAALLALLLLLLRR